MHPRSIMHTGSPMREVLDHHADQINASSVLDRLNVSAGKFFLVSAHREETVDHPDRLEQLLDCLGEVHRAWDRTILVSTHPRTRKRLEQRAGDIGLLEGLVFHEPFGFFDYNHLQKNAACTLSDSGTISEESAILGFPAVTLRESIERPESLDTGSIVMTGLEPAGVVEAIKVVTEHAESSPGRIPADYCVTDTSWRVVSFILSTIRRQRQWAGIRTVSES
jgi:UDP-N-acetylglucosamine 2-epimerase (non-hydrolysing)